MSRQFEDDVFSGSLQRQAHDVDSVMISGFPFRLGEGCSFRVLVPSENRMSFGMRDIPDVSSYFQDKNTSFLISSTQVELSFPSASRSDDVWCSMYGGTPCGFRSDG